MSDDPRLFDMPGLTGESDSPKLSYGRRLTIRHRQAIATGKHPANGMPIDPERGTCGTCAQLVRVSNGNRSWLKCPNHTLGPSSSEASDMRAGWPACPLHTERTGEP